MRCTPETPIQNCRAALLIEGRSAKRERRTEGAQAECFLESALIGMGRQQAREIDELEEFCGAGVKAAAPLHAMDLTESAGLDAGGRQAKPAVGQIMPGDALQAEQAEQMPAIRGDLVERAGA